MDMSEEAGPFLFHTGNPGNLPYLLEHTVQKHGRELLSKNIWVNLHDQLCNRIFIPSDSDPADNAALLSDLGISDVMAKFWPLYEEYGLHKAVPYDNATALHVRSSACLECYIFSPEMMPCTLILPTGPGATM